MRRHLGILLVAAILVAGLLLLRCAVQFEPAGEADVEPPPRPAPEDGYVPSAVDVPEEPPGTEVPAYPTGASDAPVVSGFTYLRHETFSCGGQTNTVAIYRCEAFARAVGLKDDETAVDCEFVLVPAAVFQMGSSLAHVPEPPVHTVTFSRSRLLARTEVTQRVWTALGGAEAQSIPPYLIGPMQPVRWRSWDCCRDWCHAAGLRLPSEAEWEYAARAGGHSLFSQQPPSKQLPHHHSDAAWSVAEFAPNAFGLHDVVDHLQEWCADSFHETYAGAPANGAPWVTPGNSLRVARSGPTNDHLGGANLVYISRMGWGSLDQFLNVTFRPAMSLE